MANQEEQLNIKEEVKDTEEQPVVGDTLTPNSETPVKDVAREEEQVPVQESSEEQPVDTGVTEEENSVEETPIEKMFSQSEVNELMGKTRAEARNRALSELLERYGAKDDNELNEVFGRGQAYDVLNDDYMGVQNQLKNVMGENALLKSGIAQEKWDDAKAILTYKGLELTPENIAQELVTHPEWNGNIMKAATNEQPEMITPDQAQNMADVASLNKVKNTPVSTIKVLGNESNGDSTPENEDERMDRIFNI